MSKALCSNKLLDDARRAISSAKQLRDNGDQLKKESLRLSQRVREAEKTKDKH
jgi:hypothetical protein